MTTTPQIIVVTDAKQRMALDDAVVRSVVRIEAITDQRHPATANRTDRLFPMSQSCLKTWAH